MSVGEKMLDLLFPPKCPFCQKILDNPRAPLCRSCHPKLPWLEGKAGERKIDFTDGCFSPLAYRDLVPEAIQRYKFSRVKALGRPFAALMARCLDSQRLEGVDLICWAPLSKKRRRERGFDQAELLAREVGRLLSIPAAPSCKRRGIPRPSPGWRMSTPAGPTPGAFTGWPPGLRCQENVWCWWTMWLPQGLPSASARRCCIRAEPVRYFV